MALEQQHKSIIDKNTASTQLGEKPQRVSNSQLELIPLDGSMYVSFYHIPYMSSAVEQQRVRQALIPFSELLIEHCIDVDARHLALYHQDPIETVTAALQRLNLGAELQQTMPHYEPLELATAKKKTATGQLNPSENNLLNQLQQFLSKLLTRFAQWLKTLRKK